jgi:hypothetical protein
MADLSEQIEDAANAPRRSESGDKVIESHPIKDLIEADRYLAGKRAAAARRSPFRTVTLSPPGTQ